MTASEAASLASSVLALVLAGFTIWWTQRINEETTSLLREMYKLNAEVKERIEHVASTTSRQSEKLLDHVLHISASDLQTQTQSPIPIPGVDPANRELSHAVTRLLYDVYCTDLLQLALILPGKPFRGSDYTPGNLVDHVEALTERSDLVKPLRDAVDSYERFANRTPSEIEAGDVELLRVAYGKIRVARRLVAVMMSLELRRCERLGSTWWKA